MQVLPNYLKKINSKVRENSEDFLNDKDFQMKEAVNILKDMIFIDLIYKMKLNEKMKSSKITIDKK